MFVHELNAPEDTVAQRDTLVPNVANAAAITDNGLILLTLDIVP